MDKYRYEVKQLISGLTFKGKILFAGITSEKLYTNYIAFENSVGWGNHYILRDASSMIYQYLIKDDIFSMEDISHMMTMVNSITPDTEDFPGILTSFALDACTAIISTLQFIIDGDDENIIDVAIFARDTVDIFIQVKDEISSLDPSLEAKIEYNYFMLTEKKRQRNLIMTLSATDLKVISDDLINQFKTTQPIIEIAQLFKL